MKASEMFVIDALILLGFALAARFINPSALGIGVKWRGTGYVLPPSTISIALATALCFFATIYSLWMWPLAGQRCNAISGLRASELASSGSRFIERVLRTMTPEQRFGPSLYRQQWFSSRR